MVRATGSSALFGVQDRNGAASNVFGCMRPGTVQSGTAVRYTPMP